MKLPDTKPQCDPEALWSLQLELLTRVEAYFGKRDSSIVLCQPRFHDCDRPEIQFTPDNFGVFAVLGCDAKFNWSYALYQLSHETVHLLDPVFRGMGNFLEEGVAVAISLHFSRLYGLNFIAPSTGMYRNALNLVNELPEGAILSARRIRMELGKFSGVTRDDLIQLYPKLDSSVATHLARKF